jgi:polyisoprenoid-binding protein YceI
MKNNVFFAGLFLLFATFNTVLANGTEPTSETYTINTEKSEITWKAYKVTGEHEGTVNLKEGGLEFNDGTLVGGKFVVNMTTITVTDLQGNYKAKLEGHLKSPDFFGVENYNTATFVITEVVPAGVNRYKVIGDMTIKETTQEIKFIATTSEADGMITAKADIQLDRSEYDVRYGSGSFFDDLGDKTIYDEFDMSITLVSSK